MDQLRQPHLAACEKRRISDLDQTNEAKSAFKQDPRVTSMYIVVSVTLVIRVMVLILSAH